MTVKLAKKIHLLSRLAKCATILGMVLFPLFDVMYWTFGVWKVGIPFFPEWQIAVFDPPPIAIEFLSVKMRFVGLTVDLIPCSFFVAILLTLTRLFQQYSHWIFFSKRNSFYLRFTGLLLLGEILTRPFYLALRRDLFSPQNSLLLSPVFGPQDLRVLVLILGLFLIAYLTEAALRLEEELLGTV